MFRFFTLHGVMAFVVLTQCLQSQQYKLNDDADDVYS